MTNKNEDPFEKMGNDYLFQESDEDLSGELKRKKKSGKKNSNRNFWIAAAIMLGVFLLVVGVLVVLTMSTLPKIQAARMEQAALINAHNTATMQAATDSVILAEEIDTETPTATEEVLPTETEVTILFSDTPVPEGTEGSGAAAQVTSEATTILPVETTPVEETAVEETTTAPEETQVTTEVAVAEVTETTEVAETEATTAVAAAASTTVSTPVPTIISGGNPAATATELPQTGFADSTGIPGLIGAALALIFVIILTRRARLSN